MFQSARLKLTAWYLLIIMFISVLFSIAFYNVATREIQDVIKRVEYERENLRYMFPGRRFRNLPSLKELEAIKRRLQVTLAVVNGIIFVFAGSAGYVLAGRTLNPIKIMIDEQNQFISSASHELRTPIATLRAEMEGMLLEKHITDQHARKLICSNLEELDNLQNLTDRLLDLSQLYDLDYVDKMEKVSITEIVQQAVKNVKPLALKKQLSINTEIQDAEVKGDKNMLIDVLVILLDNAIKYGGEQKKIQLSSKLTEKKVLLQLTDQGVGISPEDLPHIFKRFYRADKSRSQVDGYGLGLSIAKRIITIHNGKITATSEQGKGTTFQVELLLADHFPS